MIRILYVNGGAMDRGGIASYMMNYYRNIDRTKIQIDFVVHSRENNVYAGEIEKLGGMIYYIPSKRENYLKNRRELKRIMESGEYKIIHSHMDGMNGDILKMAYNAGIPIRISHSHNTRHLTNSRLKLYLHEYVRKQIPKYATHLWACSEKAGRWLYGEDNEFEVIPNAVDISRFAYNEEMRKKYRERYGIQDKIVIGHIGRFDYQKNHTFLLDVYKKVVEKRDDTVLMLIGDGHLSDEIKEKARNLGICQNIIFASQIPNVNEIINVFDMFVLPSLFEGLGIVLIEAQVNGLLCFASSEIPREAKVTDNIRFIDIDNPQKWSDRIVKYEMSMLGRKNNIKDIQRAGYDIKISAKVLEEKYLQIYKEI